MKKLLASTLLLWSMAASAQTSEHFYDFIHYGIGSDANFFFAHNDYLLFTANHPDKGGEVFVSDGTEQGTALLKDINPNGDITALHFTAFGKHTVFQVNNHPKTEEQGAIWYTDGTEQGTKRLKATGYSQSINFKVFDHYLYYTFIVDDNTYDVRRIDTTFTKDTLIARYKRGYQNVHSKFAVTSKALFYSYDDQIYRIDKSHQAPVLHWERDPATNGDVSEMYAAGDKHIWYMRNYATSKTEVYWSDDAQGTAKRIISAPGWNYIRKIQEWNGDVYISFGPHPTYYLYQVESNGAAYGLNNKGNTFQFSGNGYFEVYDGHLYMAGAAGRDKELWRTDGTAPTCELYKALATDTSSWPMDFRIINNKLFFSAFTPKFGREWYSTSGTASDVERHDLNPGSPSSDFGRFSAMFKGKLYGGASTIEYGREPWVCDGTEKGTKLLKDIDEGFDLGNQQVGSFMKAGPYLYFLANDSLHHRELWRTDGTHEGTVFLDDISPVSLFPPEFGQFIDYKSQLFATAVSFVEGAELYTSNGLPSGSKFVTPSDLFNSSSPTNFAVLGSHLYYTGTEGFLTTPVLYKSDGTKAGTKPVKNNNAFKQVDELRRVEDKLYFSAIDATGDREPFISDGTVAGTRKMGDLVTGVSSNGAKDFVGANGMVYFLGRNTAGEWSLYQSDGTVSGTEVRFDFTKHQHMQDPKIETDTLFKHGDMLYMAGMQNGQGKKKLWSNSISKNSSWKCEDPLVEEVNTPLEFAPIDNLLAFVATGLRSGQEVFITDGTDKGTKVLKNIHPTGSSNPTHLMEYNGLLIFQADDGTNGRQIWVSDGTEAGTKAVTQFPKQMGTSLGEMVGYRGLVYFAASDSQRQNSLYRLLIDSCHAFVTAVQPVSQVPIVCEGQSASLKAATSLPYNGNYSWYRNDTLISGLTGDSISIQQKGNYRVEADKNGCISKSNNLEIEWGEKPLLNVKFIGDSVFCEGDFASMSYKGPTLLNQQWLKDGKEFSKSNNISSTTSGTFQFAGQAQSGCWDTSNVLKARMALNPTPTISLVDDTFRCLESYDRYWWQLDGNRLSGENQSWLKPTATGDFSVEVESADGCRGVSEAEFYDNSSVSEVGADVTICPNPAVNVVSIQSEERLGSATLYRADGKTVRKWMKTPSSLEIGQLAPGVYFLEVETEHGTLRRKVVKH